MPSILEARSQVERSFCGRPEWLPPEDTLVVYEESTIERPWGWVFFYGSRLWQETGDLKYAIAGNAPLIYERESGRVLVAGTAHSIEYYVANYERTGDPHQP